MRKIMTVSCLLIFPVLQSCAQGGGKKEDLPLKNIYQVTKEGLLQTTGTYGLKGPVRSVEQKKYLAPEDSLIDLNEYELSALSEDAHHSLLAPMNQDCKLTFDEKSRLVYRIGRGRKFSGKAVETDTLRYDASGNLAEAENHVEGDDFVFHTTTVFEYDENGRLIRQLNNGEPDIEYSYDEANSQVRVVWHDSGRFMSDNVYTYDEHGFKVETHNYNEDGSLNVRWEHEYDELGHLEREVQYYPNGDTHELKKREEDKTIKVYRRYDKQGNCTTRLIVGSNGDISVRERVFDYY